MISQQAVRHSFAYGEGGEQFDPVKIFNSDQNQLENVKKWVDFEMPDREAELLEEASSQQHSYNLLLFGVAMKVANDEKLSSPLQLFLLSTNGIKATDFQPVRFSVMYYNLTSHF